jgi:hypothetical protein
MSSRVEFGRSLYGEEIVVDEHLASFDARVRAFLVVTTLLTGAAVIWHLQTRLATRHGALQRWLRIAAIGAVACGTWHYADNIALPAKHREPRWLYAALLVAPMDKTWGFQFVMHAFMCVGVQQLLEATATVRRRTGDDALRWGAWLVALAGAAHCVTAGHLLVDPLWVYDWDAALSILLETAFGLALIGLAVALRRQR